MISRFLIRFSGRRSSITEASAGRSANNDCEEGKATIDAQGKAVKAGRCKITRIFVGPVSPEEAFKDKEYLEVMASMNQHGIKTSYVQKVSTKGIPDMTWLPDHRILMNWIQDKLGVGKSLKVGTIDDAPENSLQSFGVNLVKTRTDL